MSDVNRDAVALASDATGAAGAISATCVTKTPERADPRVVLVGKPAFQWLRRLQDSAPMPRMDMRYLVEGATEALRDAEPVIFARWIEHGHNAMFAHMASMKGQPSPTESGTGSVSGAAEGAHARNLGRHEQGHGKRQADCKALQIGEPTFQWLKSVQRTSEPRVGMRYLLEGAFVLIESQPELLQPVIGHARRALASHLCQLARQPIPSIHLENSQ